MSLKEPKYVRDLTTVKRYGLGEHYQLKITTSRCVRNSVVDDSAGETFFSNRGEMNDRKLEASISRARSNIYQIAKCNPWDFFFTGTLNPQKYERANLSVFHTDLTQYIRDQRKKYRSAFAFLLIPELHKDRQSWHFHGLIRDIYASELHQFTLGDTMGKRIADKVLDGSEVYTWTGYSNKFGFCSLEPIRDIEAVSKYLLKYITKDLASCVTGLNAPLYYCSRGLHRAETIAKGFWNGEFHPDYQNDYCSTMWMDDTPENRSLIAFSLGKEEACVNAVV